jgi:hypothetical protein
MIALQTNKPFSYYQNSEVRVTNDMHKHYNAVGDVVGSNDEGLLIKRFDRQEVFTAQSTDIKIIKRK